MGAHSRREFIAAAATIGATAVWGNPASSGKPLPWSERRELYPEGVASGDPDANSILLWTRYPAKTQDRALLNVEVALDPAFERPIARATTVASAEVDWTCRVLVGSLKPATVYWYRFSDSSGRGSRVGRTMTAPDPRDSRPVRFAFVSCQNVCEGAQNAYRRMIFEDEHAAAHERLGFVLHLGDFIYEVVSRPEDNPQGRYDRRLRDLVRFPTGEKVGKFHIPVTLEDYRTLYRAYLHDADLQDARARWPFVPMWDNHEFSWLGWQSMQVYEGKTRPAQTRKVAANQAWFEYQPARVKKAPAAALNRFDAPHVRDTEVVRFDAEGFGQEPNNIAAVASLTAYRSVRWGRNVDLIITDQHSYRSEEPTVRPEMQALSNEDFPEMIPQEVLEILDAGNAYGGGRPPAAIKYKDVEVPNIRRNLGPQTILGKQQKAWFIERMTTSGAVWKVWGSTLGTLDWRADPQNLPRGLTEPWPGAGYAAFGGGDMSTAYVERRQIYDALRKANVTGFITVAGDRHSFWAGTAAADLPPRNFEPIGAAFITGSISAPGLVEAFEHRFPKEHPLRALYLADRPNGSKPDPSVNLLLHHGVRSCLEYRRTGDLQAARRLSNPDLAPHLRFVDMGGHGYATVRASSDALECEFVCIPRPLERSEAADGGPLKYRVRHHVPIWPAGGKPTVDQRIVSGVPPLSI